MQDGWADEGSSQTRDTTLSFNIQLSVVLLSS